VGPHRADRRAAVVAAEVAALIAVPRPGTIAEHVGSTAVPGLDGENVVDLQITANPAEVPPITEALLGLGFARQLAGTPGPRSGRCSKEHSAAAVAFSSCTATSFPPRTRTSGR